MLSGPKRGGDHARQWTQSSSGPAVASARPTRGSCRGAPHPACNPAHPACKPSTPPAIPRTPCSPVHLQAPAPRLAVRRTPPASLCFQPCSRVPPALQPLVRRTCPRACGFCEHERRPTPAWARGLAIARGERPPPMKPPAERTAAQQVTLSHSVGGPAWPGEPRAVENSDEQRDPGRAK